MDFSGVITDSEKIDKNMGLSLAFWGIVSYNKDQRPWEREGESYVPTSR